MRAFRAMPSVFPAKKVLVFRIIPILEPWECSGKTDLFAQAALGKILRMKSYVARRPLAVWPLPQGGDFRICRRQRAAGVFCEVQMLIADLHIHSRFSRATSRECDAPHLDLWARRKGVGLLGTGDFTHPALASGTLPKRWSRRAKACLR